MGAGARGARGWGGFVWGIPSEQGRVGVLQPPPPPHCAPQHWGAAQPRPRTQPGVRERR